jgi:pimeloyl-ACP methyl ester carboxylesterase
MQLSQWASDAPEASRRSSSKTQPRRPNPLSTKVHLIALDLNGHGKAPDRQASDVTRSYLEDIDAIVRAQNKPLLMGHSMGGALAQLYALENPENLSGLVLVGTGARLRVAPMIFDFLDRDPDAYFDAIPKFMFHESAPRIMVESSQAEAREIPVPVIRRDFEVCNSFDAMQDVSRISLPALIVVGDSDVMTPLKYASYLHEKIAGSDLRIIPEAGHAAMLEKPLEFNQAVLEWLKL